MRIQGTGLASRFGVVSLVRRVWYPVRHSRDLVLRTVQRRAGQEGWLIARERRYAPTIGILPGLTSESNPNPYRASDLGGDKMASTRNGYARSYAKLLRPRLNDVACLVELGVFQGASMALWCDLFPESHVIGLDIDFARFAEHRPFLESRGAFASNYPRLVRFDAFRPDPAALETELRGQTINVFVDDGPHDLDGILATASVVMPLMSPGSLYVVEDKSSSLAVLAHAFPNLQFRLEGPLVVANL